MAAGIEGTGPRLEGSVEEGGEIGVDMKIGFGNFVKAAMRSVHDESRDEDEPT